MSHSIFPWENNNPEPDNDDVDDEPAKDPGRFNARHEAFAQEIAGELRWD